MALGLLAAAYILLRGKINKKLTPQQDPTTNRTPPLQITGSTHGAPSSASSTPGLRVGEIVPHFPCKTEAEIIIRQPNRYLETLSHSSFDRQTRLRRTTPVTQEAFLSHYIAGVKTISAATQLELSRFLQELIEELKKYHIDLPGKINFIQTDCRRNRRNLCVLQRQHHFLFKIVENITSTRTLPHLQLSSSRNEKRALCDHRLSSLRSDSFLVPDE